jgi:arylsulfatase A-like enzyme
MRLILFILMFCLSSFLGGQSLPNIIFLFSDDQGYGEMGFTADGGNYATSTPVLDSMAENGAFFTRFYARTVCTPSRYSVMTGDYPFTYPGNQDYYVQTTFDSTGIPSDTLLITDYLHENGYTNLHLGKWHLGAASPDFTPLQKGFDKSFGTIHGIPSMKPPYELVDVHSFTYNLDYYTNTGFMTDVLTDTAVTWIAQQAKDNSSPFFMMFNYQNPHDHAGVFGGSDTIPYTAEDLALAPGGLTTGQKRKWAALYNMDKSVGRILDTLSLLGISENTIVIFASDNGGDDTNDADNGPYSGDKGEVAEGGVRVPMIWYHPGTVDSMTVDSLCALEDILPTLVEGVIGDAVRQPVDGINFYPLLTGGTVPIRYYHGPWVEENKVWSVYKGSMWKLVNNKFNVTTGTGESTDDIELFNMQTDGGETTDVSGSNSSVVTELTNWHNTFSAEPARSIMSFGVAPDGWINPRWWGDPRFWYDSDYYYQILLIDKNE